MLNQVCEQCGGPLDLMQDGKLACNTDGCGVDRSPLARRLAALEREFHQAKPSQVEAEKPAVHAASEAGPEKPENAQHAPEPSHQATVVVEHPASTEHPEAAPAALHESAPDPHPAPEAVHAPVVPIHPESEHPTTSEGKPTEHS